MQKRLEAQKARKEFRKMLKKSDIKRTLEEIDDYEEFYENPENDISHNEKTDARQETDTDGEDGKYDGVFLNEKEKIFYENGKDMDFVRYHKRTSRNFHWELQQIVSGDK